MEFEYDPAKSAANLAKHGIDFSDAQRLWHGRTVTLSTYAGSDESRNLVLGMIDGRHWSAITTMRDGRTRIISVRRSRKNEEEYYEQHVQGR